MQGVFRNHFLHFCCISLLAGLLFACSAKQTATPPAVAVSPRQQILPLLGYSIQAGAFAQVDNAFRLSSRLTEQGISAYYFRGEGNLYRVRFGNYPAYDKAIAAARKLQHDRLIDVFQIVRPEISPAVRYRDHEDAIRRELVNVAQQFIGVPYQWGDASQVLGFDCSGLTMMVYQLIGLDMPRISRDQFRRGREVGRDQLRPGDLVFFSTDFQAEVSHVGIYQGDDLFIHAPRSGKTVSRANLSSVYFHKRFLGGRAYF